MDKTVLMETLHDNPEIEVMKRELADLRLSLERHVQERIRELAGKLSRYGSVPASQSDSYDKLSDGELWIAPAYGLISGRGTPWAARPRPGWNGTDVPYPDRGAWIKVKEVPR